MENTNLMDKPHDECGVFGIYSSTTSELARVLYYGLYALQHRGQESAGMAITANNKIEFYKNKGLVNEVFDDRHIAQLPEGDIAIGHVLYTQKEKTLSVVNTQPVVYTGKDGMFALAMNGEITNAQELRTELIADGVIFQSKVDVEIIANLINKYYDKANIGEGIKRALSKLEGSFAMLIMTTNELIAVRDRFAMRPLCIGKCFDDIYVSSESCAIDATNADFIRDLEAGEILIINHKGMTSTYMDKPCKKSCIFEYVYIARADSIIDGTSVYDARFRSGYLLAKKLKIDADIVAGVPDSAIVAARGYSAGSGIPYVDVLEKNRYVGRTFIQPTQDMRENSVRVKLNAHRANVKDKRVILIDDSIVRGTTSRNLVNLLKKAGAKEVHLVIASPAVKFPCYTGIDMTTFEQLIAANYTRREMQNLLLADSLHFMEVGDLVECCKNDSECNGFCTACFDGEYWGIDKEKFVTKYNVNKGE